MYLIRRYIISPYDEILCKILKNEYAIDVETTTNPLTGKPNSLVFSISDIHPLIDKLKQILPSSTVSSYILSQEENEAVAGDPVSRSVIITYSIQYTQQELLAAKWLEMRCITSKIDPINCETIDGYKCFVRLSSMGHSLGRHEVQSELYTIKAPIKFGHSAFVSAYAHEERLFCNDEIRKWLAHKELVGMDFFPVLRKSTKEPIEGVYQMCPKNTIPDKIVVGLCETEDHICEQCGMRMLRLKDGRSRYGLIKGKMDENIDIWKTQPMFIGGRMSEAIDAREKLVISQRMYRVLLANKMNRGLAFVPLQEVDI